MAMATKKKTTKSVPRISYDELRGLLGKPVDDAAVTKLLEGCGKVKITADHVVAADAGFEIALEKPANAKRGAKPLLHTLFLYCTTGGGQSTIKDMLGRDVVIKHPKRARFADIPPPFDVATRAELLSKMPSPRVTWRIGDGEVAVDTPDVDHDTWTADGFDMAAHYKDGAIVNVTTTRAEA
jgi:hypothetical protein